MPKPKDGADPLAGENQNRRGTANLGVTKAPSVSTPVDSGLASVSFLSVSVDHSATSKGENSATTEVFITLGDASARMPL